MLDQGITYNLFVNLICVTDLKALCDVPLPEFPLIPASKGFCLTLRKTLVTFRDVLASVGIHPPTTAPTS